MKHSFLFMTFAAAATAVLVGSSLFAIEEKNVLDAEFRAIPSNFEELPRLEAGKWSFSFRPYGAEAASVLWSDPNVIRDVTVGDNVDDKHLATGLYVSVDEYGLNILGYGALKNSVPNLEKGNGEDNIFFECFFIPSDADNPQIINYQPFGINTLFPYWRYKLSWMKYDRNNREIFSSMKINAKSNKNGAVLHVNVPWVIYWDHLPIFSPKKDNFWRLSMIRWGGSFGAETWGGVVHSQTKCGYVRMPDFTPAQQTAMMKTTLRALWGIYQDQKNNAAVSPQHTMGLNSYRKSIEHLPHTWMNVNEDPDFKRDILIPLYAAHDAIGKDIAHFEEMSLEEQRAFYLENAPKLANFSIDVEDAYASYLKAKLMKE